MKRSTKARILLISGLAFVVIAPLFYLFVCVPGDICTRTCFSACDVINNVNFNIKPFAFESKAVDNGFHNARAGGLLAYKDKTLYAINQFGQNSLGLYAINKDSAEKIHSGSFVQEEKGKYHDMYPFAMYQNSDKIYVIENNYNVDDNFTVRKFNPSTNELTDSGLGIETNSTDIYISDKLMVWFDLKNPEKLLVKYNGKQSVAYDKRINSFDVVDGKIYYVNDFGNLYRYDPETSENKMINKKDKSKIRYLTPNQIICSDNYCYFITSESLISYPFDGKEEEYTYLLQEDKIYSLNSYGGKVYAAAESGIYELNKSECKKISDIKTKQIYIFDEQYIFTHDNNGHVLRLDPETGKADEII